MEIIVWCSLGIISEKINCRKASFIVITSLLAQQASSPSLAQLKASYNAKRSFIIHSDLLHDEEIHQQGSEINVIRS
jgi:hypothetical protein